MPSTQPPADWRRFVPTALVIAAGAALLLRVATLAEPLGIDQSLWASAARGMAGGQRLYRDVWEQRPPGIYWIYLAGFRIFGWHPSTVAILDLLAAVSTTIFVAATVRVLSSARTAALSAALFALFTMPSWIYGYGGFLERSVCETFIVACIAVAGWAAARTLRQPTIWLGLIFGLACGAAVVLKPNAGLYFPALALWVAFYASPELRWRPLVRPLAAATVGAILLPVVALLWLWNLGVLHDAKVAVLDFNRYYVGQGFSISQYATDFSKAIWLRMKTDPLWLSGGVGSVAAIAGLFTRRRPGALPGLAMVWGAAAALVIGVNGARLFNSYFINALPPLAVMAAWFLSDGSGRARRTYVVGTMATVAAMGWLLVSRGYVPRVIGSAWIDAQALTDPSIQMPYLERFGGYANDRGYSARANSELADYVRAHTTSADRIFLFGINGAGVYFASDRLTAHRFLRVNFFVDSTFPNSDFTLAAVVADLSKTRPRYLIFEQLHSNSAMGRTADALSDDPQLRDLLQHYRLERQIEDFAVYRMND